MKSAYNKMYYLLAVVSAVDVVTINLVYWAYYLVDLWLDFDGVLFTHYKMYWLMTNIAYVIAISFINTTIHRRLTEPESVLQGVSRTILLLVVTYVALIGMAKLPTPGFVKSFVIGMIAFVVISFERILMRRWVKYLRTVGKDSLNTVIIGYGPSVKPAIEVMKDKWNGLHLLGIFCDDIIDEKELGVCKLGTIDETIGYIKNNKVSEAFIYQPLTFDKRLKAILWECNLQVVRLFYIPAQQVRTNTNTFLRKFGDTYILASHHEPLLKMHRRVEKRTMDVAVSLLFLCTLYPLVYIVVAVITKLTNPGPVYFKQERTGYNGKSFLCYKFRSMRINDDADKKQATENDDRVTKFGYFMRHYNIDELPQFINVLKGDMSIVGPRPHMLAHTEYYSELINEYMVRHYVRPGITGLAQISGCRGETKTVDEMKQRVEKDIEYIENWGFWRDIVIILKTVIVAVRGDKQAY